MATQSDKTLTTHHRPFWRKLMWLVIIWGGQRAGARRGRHLL